MHDESRLTQILDQISDNIHEIRNEQMRQGKDIAQLKVWAWLSRSAIIGAFGTLFYWVKTKIG